MLEKMTDENLHNLTKFFQFSGRLKQIKRTGWLKAGISQSESVADHVYRTAMLSMIFADIESLDTLKILRMSLLHDLPETLIGDLTPSQKTAKTKEKEEKALYQILNFLPEMQLKLYLSIWNEYKEGKTIESKLIQQLDKIEMAFQAKEYSNSGTSKKSLDKFIKNAKETTEWPELKRFLLNLLEES
ncbi:MAG: HD domain-containing protein [Candidatus Bathyarchaeota archaeon]